MRDRAKLAVKDAYTFDFLELADEHSERELEKVMDDRVRLEGENAAIGIILCKSKDRTIVEYALRQSNQAIGVATYQIVVSSLPLELQGQLPAPEQVARLLGGM